MLPETPMIVRTSDSLRCCVFKWTSISGSAVRDEAGGRYLKISTDIGGLVISHGFSVLILSLSSLWSLL
ncbi:hypothetical protein CSUI_004942 [Cystoisospora suis]|uniref:Uncharacterized protein n=1 Tax=Cystoisospora suis TaxID=483139 RepID=A0A2C6KZE1_9APIC|nr:hypothetical protein CSUI_004942 [Cystoisospora suis]